MPGIARTVSRPALTYVRIGNEVVAAAIAGCGGYMPTRASNGQALNPARDRAFPAGRCVVIHKVKDGRILRTFYTGNGLEGPTAMAYAMIGSPSVYPSIGLTPASRAYLGDAAGQLWRIDLRSSNPNDWRMSIVWPIADDEDAEFYQIGREISARPALFRRKTGKIGLILGTGYRYSEDASRPHLLSLTDELVLGADGDLEFKAKLEWRMPLRGTETLQGNVIVQSGAAYFTTIEVNNFPDGSSSRGRLYGVEVTRTTEPYVTVDGRIQKVVPALPTLITSTGQRVTDALAVRLPAGRVAYGLALVTSPSCVEDEEPTKEVILNLAAGRGGEGTGGGATRIERKTGELVPGRLDNDFLSEGRNDVAIKISAAPAGDDEPRTGPSRAPFPRRVLYWGSTFVD